MIAKRLLVFAVAAAFATVLSGCSGGTDSPGSSRQAQVLSSDSSSIASDASSIASDASSIASDANNTDAEEGSSKMGAETDAGIGGAENSPDAEVAGTRVSVDEVSALATQPDAVQVELKADPADGDAVRREMAEKLALAIFTTTKIVDGELARDTSRDAVMNSYVAANSELREWSTDGKLPYDNSILMQGGSPQIASDAKVVDVQGGAYYVSIDCGTVSKPEPLEVSPRKSEIVVLFNDDNKIEHAWYSDYANDAPLHGSQEAYAAFGGKVKELIDRYGSPGIAKAPGNYDLTYATGLAYARLVDFGDGDQRLVVCYLDAANCKQPAEPGGDPEDYCVEVWQYSSGNLELAHSGTAQLDGQNSYCGAIIYNEHGGKRYLETWDGNYGGPEGDITYRAYGLDDNGGYGLVTELRNEFALQEKNYMLNGRPVSDEEGQAISNEWFNSETMSSIGFSSLKNNGEEPIHLIRDTNAVVAVLEACAATE